MSDTETVNNIQYQNAKGENLLDNKNTDKKLTTDETDFYFNLLANPSKISKKNIVSSESSEIENFVNSDSDKSSESSKKSSNKSSNHSKIISDSKQAYEKIIFNNNNEHKNNISEHKNNISEHRNNHKERKSEVNQDKSKMYDTSNFNSYQDKSKLYETPIKEIKHLTQQEIRMKKIELLRKLCEIKLKGYQLSKEYDFNSSLEEMEYEYELLKSFADKRNGVKIFKNGLLQAVSVIEFLNDKYDPFDFQLSGWSDHITVEADSWEDILEEIYEKYKGSGKKMAPEIKLLYLIIASAGAFHFTKSYSSKLPGLDSVLASNPGLLSKIINSKETDKSQFMTAQEINIEK